MKIIEVIEDAMVSAKLSDEEKKELAKLISAALQKQFHIAAYGEQINFE